jgi:hypothetical protein
LSRSASRGACDRFAPRSIDAPLTEGARAPQTGGASWGGAAGLALRDPLFARVDRPSTASLRKGDAPVDQAEALILVIHWAELGLTSATPAPVKPTSNTTPNRTHSLRARYRVRGCDYARPGTSGVPR